MTFDARHPLYFSLLCPPSSFDPVYLAFRSMLAVLRRIRHLLVPSASALTSMQQQLTSRGLARTWAPSAVASRRSLHVMNSASVSAACCTTQGCKHLNADLTPNPTTHSHQHSSCTKLILMRLLMLCRNLQAIQQTIADNKVVVYSATYCPYCSQVGVALSSRLSYWDRPQH